MPLDPCRAARPWGDDRLDDGAPLDAGADAGALRAGVDLDLVERAHLHQQHSLADRPGARVVARGLRRDAESLGRGEADGRGDVARVGRVQHRVGALVDGEVEGLAGLVPAGVLGGGDRAGEVRDLHGGKPIVWALSLSGP